MIINIDNFKMIIFDKDGTLMEFDRVWYQIGIKIVESFKRNFKPNVTKEQLFQEIGINEGIIDAKGILASGTTNDIANVFSKYCDGLDMKKWTKSEMDRISFDFISNMEMIEGTKQILDFLKDLNYKICLVTADDEMSTYKFLEKFELKTYFDLIITSDKSKYQKPNPMILNPIFNKYKISSSEIIMVGDTPTDIILGKNANLGMTIGVLSGTGKYEHLTFADIVLPSIRSIEDIMT